MSIFQRTDSLNSRLSFASRTAFDALAVEEGEDTDEEILDEHAASTVDDTRSISFSPSTAATDELASLNSKPSKNALKKAAKALRLSSKTQQESTPVGITEHANHHHLLPTHGESGVDSDVIKILVEPPAIVEATPTETSFSPYQEKIFTKNGHAIYSTDHSEVLPIKINNSPSHLTQHSLTNPASTEDLQSTTNNSHEEKSHFNNDSNALSRTEKIFLKTEDEDSVKKEPKIQPQSNKKVQNMLTRTLWTFIMISGFLLCLALGHAFMVLLVMGCATLVYREITRLFTLSVAKTDDEEAKGRDIWSKTFNWYFFAVTNYFLYGESLIYYFKHVVFADAQLLPFATNHRFISFMLYTLGFVGFVASLQKQYLKSQFGLFCWVHMTLMVIVVSSHFIINNILEGLIWFWVPASLVICNDVFAYIWGITFGRTPLIKLSPKKTVEGFVGAFFSTVLFGLVWGTFFMRFDYMICPAHNLGVNAFSTSHCNPNPVFIWREWELWVPFRVILSTLLGRTVTVVPYATYQFHLLVMSCFASLVAPFGGFFASGFKRAFDIKDFGDSIPGHGGMTDRMDCQFLMGVFTYVYYSSLIKEHHDTVGSVLQTIVSSLTLEEQLELIRDLQRYLEGKGVHI